MMKTEGADTAMRMDSRWGRVARGWAAAGFATVTAAVSHTLAGGIPPTVFGMLVSLFLAATVSTVLAGRTISMLRLGLSMGVSQVLFHALFSGLGTPTVVTHEHTATTIAAIAPTHDHGAMWMAHVLAGVITLVAFRHAEAVFWGLGERARHLVARLTRLVIPVLLAPARTLAPTFPLVPVLGARHVSPMRYRGPPREVAVA